MLVSIIIVSLPLSTYKMSQEIIPSWGKKLTWWMATIPNSGIIKEHSQGPAHSSLSPAFKRKTKKSILGIPMLNKWLRIGKSERKW